MISDCKLLELLTNKVLVYEPDSGEFYSRIGKKVSQHKTNGYLKISLQLNKQRFHIAVSRLVWIFYNGTTNNLFVCHKNNVPVDNRIENLYLATNSENIKDAYRDNLISRNRPHRGRVLSPDDYSRIKYLNANEGLSQARLARMYSVSEAAIWKIVHNYKSHHSPASSATAEGAHIWD